MLVSRIQRPPLNAKQVNYLLARRYGSLHEFTAVQETYTSIARSCGLSKQGVREAIVRFHRNGNRHSCEVPRARYVRKSKIPPEIERMLVSKEELHRMRFLALQKRCAIIEETHGIKISSSTLVRIYHRNDVRCRQAKTERRLTSHR